MTVDHVRLELRVRFEVWRLRRVEGAWTERCARGPVVGDELDWWVLQLGEARWRAARAQADFKKGSRWINRHAKENG